MNERQLDMVLGYLNEGIEIDKQEFLNEGLFSKLKDLFKKDKTKTKNDTKIEKDPNNGKSTLTEQERMKIYNDSVIIAKKIISDFKKHKEWENYFNCFGVMNKNDDDEFEDFKNGEVNHFSIIWYDLWMIKGGQARSAMDDPATGDTWCWIFNELKNRIKEKFPDVNVDYWGDWDDGPFDVITK